MIDRPAAFRAQRADVLRFCDSLSPADWRMDSRAAGWSVADVVAHMGSSCHALFTPAGLGLMRADSVERANDQLVDARRDRTPAQVFSEYRRWSKVLGATVPVLTRTPLARLTVPLAELGSFPVRLLPSASVFDQHTHLSYDIAPAVGRRAADADANRMAAVLEWMMAVLSNQLVAAAPVWFDRPLSITLTGPGGGTWSVSATGSVVPNGSSGASRITAAATEFPEWGTRRASWRDRDVGIDGDVDYGAAFLDRVNIV